MLSGQMNFITHNYISWFENRTEKQSDTDDINVLRANRWSCSQLQHCTATDALLQICDQYRYVMTSRVHFNELEKVNDFSVIYIHSCSVLPTLQIW